MEKTWLETYRAAPKDYRHVTADGRRAVLTSEGNGRTILWVEPAPSLVPRELVARRVSGDELGSLAREELERTIQAWAATAIVVYDVEANEIAEDHLAEIFLEDVLNVDSSKLSETPSIVTEAIHNAFVDEDLA